jgi:DNA replication protein DnaC
MEVDNMDEYKPQLHHILKEGELKETEETSYNGCSKCDAGYLKNGIMCDCLSLEIRKRRYANSNIDYDYASLPLIEEEISAFLKDDEESDREDGLIPINLNLFLEDYIENCVNYKNDGKGIIFNGPPGRGKSLAAMKTIMHLNDKGYSTYFITIKELLEVIKKSWKDEDFITLKNKIYNCDFLVIDDLGTEYQKAGSDWVLTELDSIMRHRYYKKLVSIFTTNSTLKKMKENYAVRIISLFHERSLIVPIVSKEDYREKLSKTPKYMNKSKFKKD